MAETKLPDYPARLGDKQLVVVDHKGPASYATGGETLGVASNLTGVSAQGLSGIDLVVGAPMVAVSGNYWVLAKAVGAGPQKTWKLLWFTASAGVPTLTQVTATTDLSAEVVKLGYIGR